jgi:Zn-dependent protease
MPTLDLANILRDVAILAVPFLVAITVHEAAHGYMAWRLGDPTARDAGRLTLNPLKHLDPMGTIVLVLTRMIGWAKPVPVDARRFADPRKGMMYVAMAGPGANFLAAICFGLAFHAVIGLPFQVPRPVFDAFVLPLALILRAGVTLNLVLGIFNLLPVPPLDGSNIVAGLLPLRLARQYLDIGRWGMFIILLLIVTGALQYVLLPAVSFLESLIL